MNKILTIKQLNNYIKGVFEDEIILHDVTVCGEISEFKLIANNTFIVLKDEDSILSCYRYGVLENIQIGSKVKITGKVSFYAGTGKVSLNIKKVEYDGEGEQRLALLRLKKQLEEEGLCKGRPLPRFISKVALITSVEGAVLHDFISVLEKSEYKPNIIIYPVRVQGATAVQTLLDALDLCNTTDADLIVMARGGGSQNDLSCFDSEILARAVNSSRIPVLSAIGHEVDYSLCDYCAAARAGTPSIAAQMVEEINSSAIVFLEQIIARMERAIDDSFMLACRKLSFETDKLYRRNILTVGRLKERVLKCCFLLQKFDIKFIYRKYLTELANRLVKVADDCINNAQNSLASDSARLDLLSPLKVIGQGYGKINLNGNEINDVSQLKEGDEINIIMRDGNADAEIKNIYRR